MRNELLDWFAQVRGNTDTQEAVTLHAMH
jgi:hypothetical protein